MPSKKQRRRVQKGRRHEYETVWVDEHGNEVEPDPEDVPARDREKPAKAAAAGGRTRSGRVVQPPSWRRSLRRVLILAPVMFLVVSFTTKDAPITAVIVPTLVLSAVFVPYSYWLDRFAYRRYLKQTGAAPAERAARER